MTQNLANPLLIPVVLFTLVLNIVLVDAMYADRISSALAGLTMGLSMHFIFEPLFENSPDSLTK